MHAYRWLILWCLMVPLLSQAQGLVTGERLPPVGVADRGELVLANNQPGYRPWNSSRLSGKVTVVLHMAGRLSAKESSSALINALATARFPADKLQMITLVNTDDAIPGSAWFVRRSIEESKQQTPGAQFVIDERGEVRKAWQLQPGGVAVVVLDKGGRVQFSHDGALSPAEVSQLLARLQTLLR